MISSRQATEKYCLLRTTQYICEEDKHYALVRVGRQGAFKSTTVYYVRAGKGLMKQFRLLGTGSCCMHSIVSTITAADFCPFMTALLLVPYSVQLQCMKYLWDLRSSGILFNIECTNVLGPLCCPKVSVWNYHSAVLKIPEDCRFNLRHGKSLKSQQVFFHFVVWQHVPCTR